MLGQCPGLWGLTKQKGGQCCFIVINQQVKIILGQAEFAGCSEIATAAAGEKS
jgi:hypothetical protein